MANSQADDSGDQTAGTVQPGEQSTEPTRPATPARRARWPEKKLETSRGHQLGNRMVGRLARLGLIPHTYQMTTIGRKTGQLHTTPVSLVEHGGQRWLVAPYGPVPWVLNARAAGRVTLERRRKSAEYTVTELSFAEAGPILRDYLQFAGATKEYFLAKKGSPVPEFVKEADRHPVFALTAISS